jgi:hypothetical protein
MAHNNLFNYGLGYYGSPGQGLQNCEDDMYGCCTTPAGPSFPNMGYKKKYSQLTALSPMQKSTLLKPKSVPPKPPVQLKAVPPKWSGVL